MMNVRKFVKVVLLAGMGVATLPSCDFMYDDPDELDPSSTVDTTTVNAINSIAYIDASSYQHWAHLKLSTGEVTIVSMDSTELEPADWDVAFHRWNAKTNGGAAMETTFTSLESLLASGTMPSGTFVEDVWTDSISYDVSQMMSTGTIGYRSSYVNNELSKWMFLDTSSMPPLYNASGKVYLLRLKNGNYAAILFTDYRSAKGATAYISIQYIYPLKL